MQHATIFATCAASPSAVRRTADRRDPPRIEWLRNAFVNTRGQGGGAAFGSGPSPPYERGNLPRFSLRNLLSPSVAPLTSARAADHEEIGFDPLPPFPQIKVWTIMPMDLISRITEHFSESAHLKLQTMDVASRGRSLQPPSAWSSASGRRQDTRVRQRRLCRGLPHFSAELLNRFEMERPFARRESH